MILKFKRIIAVVLIALLSIAIVAKPTKAAEMNFAVQAIIPSNQVDKTQTYFDLRMKPGQKQDIEVELRNDTKRAVTIEIQANRSITNDNGVVEYNNSTKKKDPSLKVDFNEIAKVQKEATLKPGTSQRVKVHLKMPQEKFDGIVLGGLYFTEKDEAKNDDKKKQKKVRLSINMLILSEFS
ncbi:hypothetical protein MFLO_10748 [Listeria floridensis FSL S10-1187]|uniref:WxL Interacting Protein peptidoglycan binding domain-containing protein n=1 Tax=Listeria floridensis FSL S10-1187 TaxID=1265817 RepID=A0ABP3AWQ7_9LIST|nr:DUF916 domain-containing protein [Listeria floridensis]EUJ30295.1 hypothetical protein MFLO_10748 [Listeria floridensis FSL S10-1187]